MAAGRCSGCFLTGSLRRISQHILSCDRYNDLYSREPGRALTPQAEHERFRTENTPQARAEQRSHRLRARFAEINRHQAATANRWAQPPDILE